MAFTINNVTLVGGNIVRDAELKYTSNGAAKAAFDIAMNRRYLNKATGETVEDTSYFKIVLWGKPAESLIDYLKKGKKIAVEGRLSQRRWTADDGSNKSFVEIVATNVVLMSSGQRQDAPSAPGQQQESQNNSAMPPPQQQESQNNSAMPQQQQQQAPAYDYGSSFSNDDVPF